MRYAVVVPWHRADQVESFLSAWGVGSQRPDWLVLQHDADRDGCAVTKNRGIARATERGAEVVVVLDDDCYPTDEARSLEELAERHGAALKPQPVGLFRAVTSPPSRGTPYRETVAVMPVAASMGFWIETGDYCAVRQLALGGVRMEFDRSAVYGSYFPLCGMNLAFRPAEWAPWCRFVDVPRFDDIWMGWMWQREAYRRGACFNLAGPLVRHVRQSDPWRNLAEETRHLERNETLWREIALNQTGAYEDLFALLPVDRMTRDRPHGALVRS